LIEGNIELGNLVDEYHKITQENKELNIRKKQLKELIVGFLDDQEIEQITINNKKIKLSKPKKEIVNEIQLANMLIQNQLNELLDEYSTIVRIRNIDIKGIKQKLIESGIPDFVKQCTTMKDGTPRLYVTPIKKK